MVEINNQIKMIFKYVVVSFLCFVNVYSANLNVQKCELSDSKCNKESGQSLFPILAAGVQELGILTSDPILFKKIDLSKGNLKLILKDTIVTGVKGCQVKKIERKVATKVFVKVQCYIDIDGNYEMSGQLLILPVQGKGKMHFSLRKLQLGVEADLQDIELNNKKHWNIISWKHSYDVKEKSDLVFENMFNGNEILGQAAREIFQTNWKDIIIELGPPLVKAVAEHVVNNVNLFFHALPVDELALS